METNSLITLRNPYIRTSTTADHLLTQTCRASPDELTEHDYATITQINHISLDMEYADDASEISSN